jgi:integrase
MTSRRVHGQGSIQSRGKNSWRIRYRVDGVQHSETFRGLKSAAQKRLTDLLAAGNRGEHVAPNRMTVSEFIEHWLTTWAPANVSAKTAETYRFHAKNLQRHLHGLALQKLAPARLAELYAALLKEGLSPRTVGHAHRVLHGALEQAVAWQLLPSNPASKVSPPRVPEKEIELLRPDQLQAVLAAVKGMPIYPLVELALASGMRRGELLALRSADVDLDRATVRIERSVEQTVTGGLSIKAPKTRRGRRRVSLPPTTVELIRRHWREQQEQRFLLGQGKAKPDDLVFPNPQGELRSPNALSQEWKEQTRKLGLTATFHSLRHTHASQLIAQGVDILTISRRLGHSKPTVTLDVYGHMFPDTDDRAASIMEATLLALKERIEANLRP